MFALKAVVRAVCLLLVLSGFAARGVAQDALALSANALYKGEFQQAADIVSKHLQKYPGDAPARVLLARAELGRGNFQGALQNLRAALKSDPRNIDAHYYLAIVARVLAQQEYERLYALAPDSDRVHQLMGEAAVAAEKAAEAEAEFKLALERKPRSLEVLINLGELKRIQSNFDEAIIYFKRAEEIAAADYDIAYGLGVCYTYKQDYPRAITYLEKAVALAPDSGAGRFALGNALFQNGQMEAAIPVLKASLEFEPGLKQSYYLLGRAYQKLGRADEAKLAFRKIDEINRQQAPGAQPQQPAETDEKPSAPARKKTTLRP